VATPSAEPTPDWCWPWQRKVWTAFQVLRRMGSEEGDWRYDDRYDLDHDGDIDWRDFEIIFEDIRTC
jgi:hypothetical protein